MTDLGLFDLPPGATLPSAEPTEKLSADQRRTLARLAALHNGRHPLGGKLHPDAPDADDKTAPGPRCGSCAHLCRQSGVSGNYLKCDVHVITRGPSTDVRAWWPACIKYEAADHA